MHALATKTNAKPEAQSKHSAAPVQAAQTWQPTLADFPAGTVQRKCACGGGCPRCEDEKAVQTKLTIGPPGDRYEHEADRVAGQVMAMPDRALQRHPSELDDEERVQAKPLAAEITPLAQRHPQEPVSNEASALPSGASQAIENPSGGAPLPDPVRRYMEPRFGADFSSVRLHSGSQSGRLNRSLESQAFTYGRDIWLGAGESESNLPLLAHELTHVIQQSPSLMRAARLPPAGPLTAVPLTLQRACPTAPTGLGATLRKDCDRKPPGIVGGDIISFCQDSDQVVDGDKHFLVPNVIKDAKKATRIELHGNASTEGPTGDYNFSLACARAIVVRDLLSAGGVAAPVQLFTHGPTDAYGPSPQLNRIVVIVIERPPTEKPKPVEPSVKEPVKPVPSATTCDGRHTAYCAARDRDPANFWLTCVCNVSIEICLNVMRLRTGVVTNLEWSVANQKAKWFETMNACMFLKWSAAIKGIETGSPQAGATAEWASAIRVCNDKGRNSKECCDAQVEGEQSGFTQCLSVAGKYDNANWEDPGGWFTPAAISGKDFNDEKLRFQYGKDRCCSASNFTPSKTGKGTVETPEFAGTQPRIVEYSSGAVKIEGEKHTIPLGLFCPGWQPGAGSNMKTLRANDAYKAAYKKLCL